MTEHEQEQLAILATEFKAFQERYERDQKRAETWREMFDGKLECKVIKPLYGNGEVGFFTRIAKLESDCHKLGLFLLAATGGFLSWLGLK